MPISRAELDAWGVQLPQDEAGATFAAIRRAVLAPGALFDAARVEVFAHGSRARGTNIHASDPIDIVVLCKDALVWDVSALAPGERALCAEWLRTERPSVEEFDAGVQQALRSAFGFRRDSVEARNFAINVAPAGATIAARVVVAARFRRYELFRNVVDQRYVDMIALRGRQDGLQRLICPSHDAAMAAAKDRATRGAFTRVVRMMKHARDVLVGRGRLTRDEAPSYFIESLLSNVPENRFVNEPDEAIYDILQWLKDRRDFDLFLCEHRQGRLFGPSATQWSVTTARRFHAALAGLWNEWERAPLRTLT